MNGASGARRASDKTEAFELQDHLVYGRWADAEERLHIGFGGGQPMQRGVGVDEGEVLALQGRVGDGGRGRRGRARHAANLRGDGRRWVDESPGEGPAKGMRLVPVPVTDETEHVAGDVLETLEAAVAKDAALKNAEPDLDLIDPGSVRGV